MTAVQIIATTMLAALFFTVLGCAAWVRRKTRANLATWEKHHALIHGTPDVLGMHQQTESAAKKVNTQANPRVLAMRQAALDAIRAQASAAALHDICQPLGVPLTVNPHLDKTLQHKAWQATYHHSMRIAIQLERSKS